MLVKNCFKDAFFIVLALFLCHKATFAQSIKQTDWQQEVHYKIAVSLNDDQHILKGFETFEYVNNSPNVLTEIYMHLWPNAYKNDSTALARQLISLGKLDFKRSGKQDRGYIDSLDFKVNGEFVQCIIDPQHIDICKIVLNEPLLSGERIEVTTPFKVKIPYSFSRLGHVGHSYQITQWYPKPAVYDKNGWHPMPYLDQGEFYSEYGTFDVSITVPANYIVAATGNLQNEKEKNFLDSIADVTSRQNSFDKNDATVKSSAEWKTLRYIQSNVHDFAWFADKGYHVLKGEVELPNSKRKVTTMALFTNVNARYWKNAIEYLNDAVYYYSLWNGDYPYDCATAVDGHLSAGAGMEYPTITVIGNVPSKRLLEITIAHEVGHNWFYGILGSNERDHGWMDEGINTYYERRYVRTKYPQDKLLGANADDNRVLKCFDLQHYTTDYQNNLLYLFNARINEDQPIETPAADFTEINTAAIMYGKTGLLFRYLEQCLGTEVFDSCMKLYFERWKFRHPQPEDLRAAFEQSTGKDLTWFFDGMISTNKKIDFKIKSVKDNGENYQVKIKNTSLAAPTFVSTLDKKGELLETFKTDPFVGTAILFFEKEHVHRVTIDPYSIIPEINQQNNSMRVKSAFKEVEPLRLQFLGSLQNRNRTQLYFTPLFGYNYVDKWMPGIAFYNHVFPFKNFEFEVVPLYSIATQKMNGTGRIAYNWYPNRMFQRFTLYGQYNSFSEWNEAHASLDFPNYLNTQGSYYTRFRKIGLNIEVEFKRNSYKDTQRQYVRYRNVFVEQKNKFKPNTLSTELLYKKHFYYGVLNYEYENKREINPFSFKSEIENISTSDLKFSTNFNYSISYKRQNKSIDIRLFAGYSTPNDDDLKGNLFSLDGLSDYKYDNAYIRRADVYQQQFYVLEGGFKSKLNLSNVQKLFAFNVQIPIPARLPLGLYGDVAVLDKKELSINTSYVYDAGIYIPLLKKVAEIYFPLYVSTDRFVKNKPKYEDRIRFMININAMNPFTTLKKLKLF